MEDNFEDFEQSGKTASKIREDSRRLIMIGEGLLDIAETIEQMIFDEGCRPAFPVNISINEIAAHYTPEIDCTDCLNENDVVKIDLGVHINGAIADTAYTIDLGEKNNELVKASEDALETAISAIKPGVSVGEIGGLVEEKIKSFGFKPISNLTGHMIKRNILHAGIDVPNIKTKDPYEFAVGDIFAVEPFATTGQGYVVDTDHVEIFSLYLPRQIRMRQSRKILQTVVSNYGTLPFAERWIRKEFKSKMLVGASLRELLDNNVIKGYPVLKEAGKGLVSQTEHTMVVEEKGARVLTK